MIKNKTKTYNFYNYFFIFLILLLILLLVIMPEKAISTFSQGLIMWGTKILPALLPFFLLTNLLSYTTFTNSIGKLLSPITQKLYGVGGVAGYIYIMSILSGYPVGAKLTSDLYKQGAISSRQAITISSFTSTSGPLFVIGTVGIGFFNNLQLGVLLLLTHLLGALANGLLWKRKTQESNIYTQSTTKTNNILNDSMVNSIISIMCIGGFVAIFYMFLQILFHLQAFDILINFLEIFHISPDISSAIISGIIEVTSGAFELSKTTLSAKPSLMILSFLISFGGLSIHAQAYCFLKEFNMPYFKFFLQKITHAILSTIFAIPLSLIF